uniref:Uncharacterized protein n=1 Tax=Cucumis sativus TaxID=3659 RepID=A0A0A0LT93_CUCSA
MALFSFTANGIRMIPSDKTCQSPMASFFLPSFVLILDLHLFPIHGGMLVLLWSMFLSSFSSFKVFLVITNSFLLVQQSPAL